MLELLQPAAESSDELGDGTDEVDIAGIHVVQWEHGTDGDQVLLGQCDTEQQALQSGLPRVLRQRSEAELCALGGAQSPADAGRRDQVAETLVRFDGESEPTGDGGLGAQLQHHRCLGTRIGQSEKLGEQPDQRIDRGLAPISQLQSEAGRRMRLVRCRSTECGIQQWPESFRIGSDHRDMARLQGPILPVQLGQHFSQHLDLAGRAVREV